MRSSDGRALETYLNPATLGLIKNNRDSIETAMVGLGLLSRNPQP